MERQITQPSTVTVGQVLSEGSVFLLFDGEQYNGYCEALLTAEEREEGWVLLTVLHITASKSCRKHCIHREAAGCNSLVRFEVFTAVIMKNVVFWDVMPCDSC
jgi:hypothetical protein